MLRDDWEHALVRAVVERSFRARLLTDPADALSEYGLAEIEAGLVESAQARSLHELAAHLLRLSAGVWRAGNEGLALFGGW